MALKARVLTLSSLAHFINDGSGITYATVYPIFVLKHGFTYIDISIVSATYLVSSALMSLLIGRIADITGKPSLLLGLGIGLWSLALILLSVSLNTSGFDFGLLLASALFGGIASSFYHPLGASIISSYFDKDKGFALGINGSLGALGRSSYPTIITSLLILSTLGIYFLASVSLLSSILIVTSIRDRKSSRGKQENRGGKMFERKVVIILSLLTLIALVKGALSQGFITFLPTFLVNEGGVSYGVQVGALTTLALVGSVISQPLLGKLSDFLGRGKTMLITTALGGIAVIAYTFLYTLTIISYILLFTFGLFAFEAFTLLLAYVSDLVPSNYLTTANSIVWGIGLSAGGSLGPLIVGVVATYTNLSIAFIVLGVLDLIALIFILVADKYKLSS